MPSSPPRRIERVSSRVKGKYKSGENLGNVEAILDTSLAASSFDDADSGRKRKSQQPYGLRRIFSNPVARRQVVSTESRCLHRKDDHHHHDDDETKDEESSFALPKQRPYGLRRIFSNPSKHDTPTYSAAAAAPAVSLIKTKSYHPPSRTFYHNDNNNDDDIIHNRMPPLSLTRRVSRLRYVEKEVEVELGKPVMGDGEDDDDDTFVDSVDVGSSSFSSSSSFMKLVRKKSKITVALFCLVGFLGMAGVGTYLALGLGKNKPTHSSFSSSMQTGYWNASNGFHSESFPDSTIANVTKEGRSPANSRSDSDDIHDNDASQTNIDSSSLDTETPTYLPTAPPPLALLNPTPSPLAMAMSTTTPPIHRPPPPSFDPPTPHPSDPPPQQDTTTIIFYVMADSPYSDRERETIMPNAINSLPQDAELLFHLGDLEYKKKDQCAEWAYEVASRILRRSRVPVFVVPGDNDLNDCEDHDKAEQFWTKYYGSMDQNWSHSLSVTRWGKLDESFSFLHNRILFFGINIVGGKPYDDDEKTQRHAEHLRQLKRIMNTRSEEYDIVVLLGHAEPKSRHADLFEGEDGLAQYVSEMKKPFVHIHGDYHSWYEREKSFGVKNYLRISLDSLIRDDDGEVAMPTRVEIDSSKEYGAVKISRGRSDWDVECCSEGWPRISSGDDDDDDDDLYEYSSSSEDTHL
eukprot:CCRYP_013111-RA/>CCRYP_013111-RA protein AED:0.03 eAED:0.03 QI:477/1/1/1/1/1/2/201/687